MIQSFASMGDHDPCLWWAVGYSLWPSNGGAYGSTATSTGFLRHVGVQHAVKPRGYLRRSDRVPMIFAILTPALITEAFGTA